VGAGGARFERAARRGATEGLSRGAPLALLVAAAACSDAIGPASGAFCASRPASAVVTFADPALELAIRSELSLSPQLDLTCGRVAAITDLDAAGVGITSLDGIDNLTGLTTLWIRANAISDITPLAELTGLTSLSLAANQISDVEPLRLLTQLTFLAINENGAIADIDALSGLTSLAGTLWLGSNAITSLAPLSGLTDLAVINAWDNELTSLDGLETLTGLTNVSVHTNRITDVSALADLPALRAVTLRANPDLEDIQPLIANAALGTGTDVNLSGTSVACADVAALEAKGVAVISDCP
jgi:Leucine-rich repeat (LRR) protein